MPTLLLINSSPLPTSVSRELTAEFVKNWKDANPHGEVITRDLPATKLSILDGAWVGAAYTPEANRAPEQKAALALSDELITELEKADEYVIGVAMHNFSITASLKLWIDQIARVGKTFAYSETGPQGLLKGKKATFLVATGGNYEEGSAFASYNFATPYLKAVLGFIGVTDVTVVTASGTSALMSPDTDRVEFLKPTLDKVRSLK